MKPSKRCLLMLSVLTSLLTVVVTHPAQAQTRQCAEAIAAAENSLNAFRNLSVELSELRSANSGHPANRPNAYSLAFQGEADGTVMNSPSLMLDLTSNIINNCDSISMVRFGVYQTDWGTTFGLVGDRVQEFECIPLARDARPRWGQQTC